MPDATQAGTNESSDRTFIGADPIAAYCRANEALPTAPSRYVSEHAVASYPSADVGNGPAHRTMPLSSLVEQVGSAIWHAILPSAEANEDLPVQAEVPAVPDAPVPVVLSNGTVVQNPLTGGPLLQPAGVSLAQNAQIGRAISLLRSGFSLPGTPMREAAMAELFLPGQPMDYQRIYGNDGLINRSYIAFGNYNFGVVAAVAGYTKEEALLGAGAANLLGRGDKSGALFNNPINAPFISAGYDAYKAGMIGGPSR